VNKGRRKAIDEVKDKLAELMEQVNILCDEEQEYFDNMPESFQQGEKGTAAESATDELSYANSSI
jgi:uncharacterized coiled-coil DUF342 family protein